MDQSVFQNGARIRPGAHKDSHHSKSQPNRSMRLVNGKCASGACAVTKLPWTSPDKRLFTFEGRDKCGGELAPFVLCLKPCRRKPSHGIIRRSLSVWGICVQPFLSQSATQQTREQFVSSESMQHDAWEWNAHSIRDRRVPSAFSSDCLRVCDRENRTRERKGRPRRWLQLAVAFITLDIDAQKARGPHLQCRGDPFKIQACILQPDYI